jgi:hypothetical protein
LNDRLYKKNLPEKGQQDENHQDDQGHHAESLDRLCNMLENQNATIIPPNNRKRKARNSDSNIQAKKPADLAKSRSSAAGRSPSAFPGIPSGAFYFGQIKPPKLSGWLMLLFFKSTTKKKYIVPRPSSFASPLWEGQYHIWLEPKNYPTFASVKRNNRRERVRSLLSFTAMIMVNETIKR